MATELSCPIEETRYLMHLYVLQKSRQVWRLCWSSHHCFFDLLQTIFDLVISTFLEEEVMKKQMNRNFRTAVVNHGLERRDKRDSDSGTARY